MCKILATFKGVVASAILATTMASATQFITIMTGGVTGTYFPTGGAICKIINQQKGDTKPICDVRPSNGSIDNINHLKAGDIDFGLAQSDTVYQTYHGLGEFKNKKYNNLRSVMAIYPELLALVVRKDSNITKFDDIKGKVINIDTCDSGTHFTVKTILKSYGIKNNDFKKMTEIKFKETPKLLGQHKIDGYFGMFGHPTINIKESIYETPVDLISISSKYIDYLIKKYPYYLKGVIKKGTYKGIDHDTPTIGVKAILVTSSDVDEKTVYYVSKTILDNFDKFKEQHPVYKNITKKSLLEGLTIKQHKGAIRAFKEAGLL